MHSRSLVPPLRPTPQTLPLARVKILRGWLTRRRRRVAGTCRRARTGICVCERIVWLFETSAAAVVDECRWMCRGVDGRQGKDVLRAKSSWGQESETFLHS